jgi:hypothetical protein
VDDLLRTVKLAVFVGSSRRDLQACPTEAGRNRPSLIKQRLREAIRIHEAKKEGRA